MAQTLASLGMDLGALVTLRNLKHALREHLSASPYVAHHRPGDRHEGGDAVTVVELRR